MKSTFTIAGRKVGIFEPAYVIAEAGVNHDCRLDRGKALVETAKAAGPDAMKAAARAFRMMPVRA